MLWFSFSLLEWERLPVLSTQALPRAGWPDGWWQTALNRQGPVSAFASSQGSREAAARSQWEASLHSAITLEKAGDSELVCAAWAADVQRLLQDKD